MAEQTFRSPGFFEQEIDLSARQISAIGTPAGVIGTSEFGPAFVPVTVGSFVDFETRFGTLDSRRFGPYAVREFLKHKTALTYMRVLGAGANETSADIQNTRNYGFVKSAGFVLSGTGEAPGGRPGNMANNGGVAFIAGEHRPLTEEAFAYSLFTDNQSFSIGAVNTDPQETVKLVRGVVFLASGTCMQVMDNTGSYADANRHTHAAVGSPGSSMPKQKYFKLVLSSSSGAHFSMDEGKAGIKILTASLDPTDEHYISKVLNTDPLQFQSEEHLLYLDFAVEHELAPLAVGPSKVAILTGSVNTTSVSSNDFNKLYGRYDTRYSTPKTTSFISQPYGAKEYDLFHFETISDGSWANEEFKISIANVRASTDPKYDYGTFEVQVRKFVDKDSATQILERYPECNLDPSSDRYIAKVIGDKKVRYDFDQELESERRLLISGKFPNVSPRIRVVMYDGVTLGKVPQDALPFGFRGIPVLKTTDSLTDSLTALSSSDGSIILGTQSSRRLACLSGSAQHGLVNSIVPPLPYRFKVTRGAMAQDTGYIGQPGTDERVDGRLYWGVNNIRLPLTASVLPDSSVMRSNDGNTINPIVKAYTKFQGIQGLDALVTGSGADNFNSNKFTLARVALSNRISSANKLSEVVPAITGSAREHMLEAAYIRDGNPDKGSYTIDDRATGVNSNRITLASLIHTSSVVFNRFTEYAKFTNIFYGGFDGVNILDRDQAYFRDRAFSTDTGGKSQETVGAGGVPLTADGKNQSGFARKSNANASVRSAINIMTDPLSSNINILAIPGVRETFVTDYALEKTRDYSQAIYLMDSMKYDESGNRLYDDSRTRVAVRETAEQFESRAIDNNYGATYFPDVIISDPINNLNVSVPSSVAALGTLAFSDSVSHPWFAPAGFNRGSMDFVVNVENRLSSADRDLLYDARINPIAVFPTTGFVIFGQKTMQFTKSALDRVNVRRLLLEIKRQIVRIADKLLFEPNNAQTRARFVTQAQQALSVIQSQSGIEQFRVICDGSNNTVDDVEQNKMNGRIVIVPTRAVEFISVDFIITNSGVDFEN